MNGLFDLTGKITVLTGGLGQLGIQIAVALADHGGKTAILDLHTDCKSESLNTLIKQGLVKLYQCNITDKSSVENIYNQIRIDLGVPDILINNAALDSPPNAPASENGPFEDYLVSSLEDILNVNIKGAFICCQIFGKAMAEKGYGRIINIASIYGVGSPVQDIYEYKRVKNELWFKPAAYGMSKAAIINFTKYLATYWAKKGVNVNSISPAGIFNNQDQEFLNEFTSRIPIGRMANKNELNGAVIFLASEASSYVTGTNLMVDGGWTAW